ncbi:LamG domain-containing protein, partial [bacterium AH-315-C07]|nr:LamG domain-containing protein [bacterium AH-315-C07]
MTVTSAFSYTSDTTINGDEYLLKVSGTYGVASGHGADAAYRFLQSGVPENPPVAYQVWTWNGGSTRPSPDIYDSAHYYNYKFTGNGQPHTFDFTDGGGYGDNSGSLDFELYHISNCASNANCLVASYPFNSNANDESGNGNNGTVNGATLTADRFGNDSSAYYFDGIDDQIRMSNFTFPSQDVTISVWCKTPVDQTSSLFRNNVSNSNIVNSHIHYLGSIDAFWDYGDITTNDGRLVLYDTISASLTNLNQWENYVFVSNLTDNKMDLYINGIKIMTKSPASFLSQTTFDFMIGGDTSNTGGDRFYEGFIDEFKIYNCALDSIQIDSIYQAEKPPAICTLQVSAGADFSICTGDTISLNGSYIGAVTSNNDTVIVATSVDTIKDNSTNN